MLGVEEVGLRRWEWRRWDWRKWEWRMCKWRRWDQGGGSGGSGSGGGGSGGVERVISRGDEWMSWRRWRFTWHRVCHHEAIWIQLVYCAMSTTDTWLQAKLSSSSVITSVGPLSPLLKNAFWGTNFFNSSNPSAMRDSSFPLNIMKPRGRPPAGDAHISLNSWWLAWSRDPVALMKTCDKWWGTIYLAQQLLTVTTTVTTVTTVTTMVLAMKNKVKMWFWN